MMKKIISLSIIFLSIWGCSGGGNELSPDKLKNLVISAAEGRRTANDSLAGIFNMGAVPGTPLGISIDTISFSGRKYSGVAVEFSNPINNRFALYDEHLNCYIIDRSLNGKLLLRRVKEYDFTYFSLEETYNTNDNIELKRLSIYRGDSTGFNLSFRTFTMMKTIDTVFTHDLYAITPDLIRATIIAPQFSGINNINDDYLYDSKKKVYTVKKSVYFDEFVTEFINSIKDTTHKFISPAVSATDKDVEEVFAFTSGNTPEYYLSLDENWRELRNKPGGTFLKKDITGSKFVNDRLNSNIYVFKIPFYEDAEDYFSVTLGSTVNGKYTVRYSGEIVESEYIKKYFEYSCSTKKFLLLLSAARGTYQVNKHEYFEIINTFYIDC
jgi:hypothetical protein